MQREFLLLCLTDLNCLVETSHIGLNQKAGEDGASPSQPSEHAILIF